jgi:X-Pro dipeptidyl-peptidase
MIAAPQSLFEALGLVDGMRTGLVVGVLLAASFAGCLGFGGGSVGPDAPIPALAALSPVIFSSRIQEPLDVPSSMDGSTLHADVYRPDAPGPFPSILVLSPYWSFGGDAKQNPTPTWYIDYFVPRGYAVVLAEMRGTRESDGCWDFGGKLDQKDGYDFVEGIAAQSWSNGKVGMLGQSHVGMSQIAAAITAPPHLTTIVPIAAVSDWYRYLHKDGAPYVINRGTPPAYFAVHASPSNPPAPQSEPPGTPGWLLTQAQTVCMDNVVHVSQSAELDGDKDAYWQERDLIAGAPNIKASVFLVHGFLDENVKTDHFLDFWNALPSGIVKKAWFGQWPHSHPQYAEWREDLHQWFDYWLLGLENGILAEPTVVVQDNTRYARNETAWPPADVTNSLWMLDGDQLLPAVDGTTSATALYYEIPGLDRDGPSQPLHERVVFTSEPRVQPLHIAGEPVLHFEGELDQPLGRWIAILFDIDSNGRKNEITRGYLDARHAKDLRRGEDVAPGMHPYSLKFFPRDHVVGVGNRTQLVLVGADLGQCATPTQLRVDAATCEGTGILPAGRLVHHFVKTGSDPATRLMLPVTPQPTADWKLTPLATWLTDLPP